MSLPFKSLAPFSPRFFEVEYAAPAGACCVGFEIDAGDDKMFMPNGFGLDSPLQLTGSVKRGGVDASNQGVITWTMVSGPASITIDDTGTLTPTLHFTHYMGPYVFRMTFDSSDGIISDDVTIFIHQYSLDTLGLAGWNTLIGGIAPKCILTIWNITGPDQRRRFIDIPNNYVGDDGNGTPAHPGDEIGYGSLLTSDPVSDSVMPLFGLDSATAQQFFATITYNVPDGDGEKSIEIPVSLIDGVDPDHAMGNGVLPPSSDSGTTFFPVPLDGNGFPVFPLHNPIAPATTIEWKANGTPNGYRVSDYRDAQVRTHLQHIIPLSPELPHG